MSQSLGQPASVLAARRVLSKQQSWLPPLACCLLAITWFWPITFAGQRPTGGEISTEFRPAMQFYGEALHRDRLPLWNEQDGLGTPIHASGQLGVLYPLRLLLYRVLNSDDAYAASMVLHHALAAWFAYLCARGFGLSQRGAMLTAVAFMGQGFFVVNLSRPWSYTAGCWLPLAVLATWRWIEHRSWTWWFALSVVLGMQLFAGHFQLAFQTVLIVLLIGCSTVFRRVDDRWKRTLRAVMLLPAIVLSFLIAGAQLVPTLELLQVADWRGRGEEFLGSFAMPPLQLVHYLAPTLLQHPLWEPSVWTAFQSSPTQCLQYVGIVPLGLAVWVAYTCRRDHRVNLMCGLVIVATLLGLGPYLPYWKWIIRLPGLGWFSSSARWGIVSGLFLALLAGVAVDRLDPRKFAAWCRIYAVTLSLALVGGVGVATFYLLKMGAFPIEGGFAFRLLAEGVDLSRPELFTTTGRVVQLLRSELTLPVLNIGLLLVVSLLAGSLRNQNRLAVVILIWSVIDLGIANQLSRRVAFESAIGLEQQSPVMAHLARLTVTGRHNVRVAGPTGRRPMSLGINGLGNTSLPDMQAYWHPERRDVADYWPEAIATVPVVYRFGDMGTKLAREAWVMTEDDIEFLRLVGIRWLTVPNITGTSQEVQRAETQRLFPDDLRGPLRLAVTKHARNGQSQIGRYHDPWLSSDVFGEGILRMLDVDPRLCSWSIWEVPQELGSSRSWIFPVDLELPGVGKDPRLMRVPPPARRKMLEMATPATVVSDSGERVQIEGTAERPSVLILSDLYYPGWHAQLDQAEKTQTVRIEKAFGACRAIAIPQVGTFRITLMYAPESFRIGGIISGMAGTLWLTCVVIVVVSKRKLV